MATLSKSKEYVEDFVFFLDRAIGQSIDRSIVCLGDFFEISREKLAGKLQNSLPLSVN